MARVAQMMAMENDHIKADVVEVQEFPQIAQRYRVMGVPKTVINETTQFIGAVPEETFMDKVLEGHWQGGGRPGLRGVSAVHVNLRGSSETVTSVASIPNGFIEAGVGETYVA